MHEVKDLSYTNHKTTPSVKIEISHQTVFIVFVTVLLSTAVLIDTKPVQSLRDAQMYLSKYGYYHPASYENHLIFNSRMHQAVSSYQTFVGMVANGELDYYTLQYMSMPRCGNEDKYTSSRPKRPTWSKKQLTYAITKYTNKMHPDFVDAAISRAFQVWSDVTDFSFTKVYYGPSDIEISFEEGYHGDVKPFNGSGFELAHTFGPENGDVHFDEAEQWTLNSRNGINLFQLAAHEFGHSLGLKHTSEKAALMFPEYNGFDPSFRLHSSDITAIQKLYGRKTNIFKYYYPGY